MFVRERRYGGDSPKDAEKPKQASGNPIIEEIAGRRLIPQLYIVQNVGIKRGDIICHIYSDLMIVYYSYNVPVAVATTYDTPTVNLFVRNAFWNTAERREHCNIILGQVRGMFGTYSGPAYLDDASFFIRISRILLPVLPVESLKPEKANENKENVRKIRIS